MAGGGTDVRARRRQGRRGRAIVALALMLPAALPLVAGATGDAVAQPEAAPTPQAPPVAVAVPAAADGAHAGVAPAAPADGAAPKKRAREPKQVALATPAAVAIAPAAAPAPVGLLASAGTLIVALVAAAGFVALFGMTPTPGVAVAALSVLLLLVLLAVIVPVRLAARSRRQRPVGPPVALPVRDLGPNTIGQLGREGSAEPVEPRLAPATLQRGVPANGGRTAAPGVPASPEAPSSSGPSVSAAPLPLSVAMARGAQVLRPRTPAGFDADAFVASAREHFLRLQQAWDDGDTAGMEAMMTPAMIGRVHGELERRQSERSRAERTEVLDLSAELLGVATIEGHWTASVRFRGAMRDLDATVALDSPDAFDEIWNFDCADRATERWLLAGIEPLHV